MHSHLALLSGLGFVPAMLSLLLLIVAAICMVMIVRHLRTLFRVAPRPAVRRMGRWRFADVSIPFKLAQGYAGVVNRQHPASILPYTTGAMTVYGQGAYTDPATGQLRPLGAADGSVTSLTGVTVRPYPTVQTVGTPANALNTPFGNSSITATGSPVVDVLLSGFIYVSVVGTPKRGDPVFVWTAASSGQHVQGGFEAVATAGSTVQIGGAKTFWAGAPDANGVAELAFNV